MTTEEGKALGEGRENGFEGYAVLELMGHRRLAGYVREEEHFGVGLIRIDVLHGETEEREVTTQYYSPSALYALTPTTEEVVRAAARRNDVAPVQRWELPAAKPREEPAVDFEEEEPFDGEEEPF